MSLRVPPFGGTWLTKCFARRIMITTTEWEPAYPGTGSSLSWADTQEAKGTACKPVIRRFDSDSALQSNHEKQKLPAKRVQERKAPIREPHRPAPNRTDVAHLQGMGIQWGYLWTSFLDRTHNRVQCFHPQARRVEIDYQRRRENADSKNRIIATSAQKYSFK